MSEKKVGLQGHYCSIQALEDKTTKYSNLRDVVFTPCSSTPEIRQRSEWFIVEEVELATGWRGYKIKPTFSYLHFLCEMKMLWFFETDRKSECVIFSSCIFAKRTEGTREVYWRQRVGVWQSSCRVDFPHWQGWLEGAATHRGQRHLRNLAQRFRSPPIPSPVHKVTVINTCGLLCLVKMQSRRSLGAVRAGGSSSHLRNLAPWQACPFHSMLDIIYHLVLKLVCLWLPMKD